jgi:hypothetical protein
VNETALELQSVPVGELLERWRGEAAEHRKVEANARDAAERKERAVAALEEALGIEHGPTVAERKRESIGRALRTADPELRGIAAVRAAIAQDPVRAWKAREIHDLLVENGWINRNAGHPLRGTEAAISRLVNKGELERVGRGEYRLRGLGVIPED